MNNERDLRLRSVGFAIVPPGDICRISMRIEINDKKFCHRALGPPRGPFAVSVCLENGAN